MINVSKIKTIHFRSNNADSRYVSVSVSSGDSLEEINLDPSVAGMRVIARKNESNLITAVIPSLDTLASSYTYKIGVTHDN